MRSGRLKWSSSHVCTQIRVGSGNGIARAFVAHLLAHLLAWASSQTRGNSRPHWISFFNFSKRWTEFAGSVRCSRPVLQTTHLITGRLGGSGRSTRSQGETDVGPRVSSLWGPSHPFRFYFVLARLLFMPIFPSHLPALPAPGLEPTHGSRLISLPTNSHDHRRPHSQQKALSSLQWICFSGGTLTDTVSSLQS